MDVVKILVYLEYSTDIVKCNKLSTDIITTILQKYTLNSSNYQFQLFINCL